MNLFKKNIKKGFTLIEMVIVIAIIGIIASMIMPKTGAAFNDAEILSVVQAAHSLQTGVVQYVAKKNVLPWGEKLIIKEKLMDGSAVDSIKIGTPRFASGAGDKVGVGPVNGFDLDGDGTPDTTAAERVVEIIIYRATAEEARAISLKFDKAALTPALGVADNKGRVEYNAGTGFVNVYIYIESK